MMKWIFLIFLVAIPGVGHAKSLHVTGVGPWKVLIPQNESERAFTSNALAAFVYANDRISNITVYLRREKVEVEAAPESYLGWRATLFKNFGKNKISFGREKIVERGGRKYYYAEYQFYDGTPTMQDAIILAFVDDGRVHTLKYDGSGEAFKAEKNYVRVLLNSVSF